MFYFNVKMQSASKFALGKHGKSLQGTTAAAATKSDDLAKNGGKREGVSLEITALFNYIRLSNTANALIDNKSAVF